MQESSSKPTVGVLTTFYSFDKAYSLVSVVEAQLQALVKHGYHTVLYTHDNFTDDALVPAGVEIRKVVPRFHFIDYSQDQAVDENFQGFVDLIVDMLRDTTKDIDVIFQHDLLFQGWFLPFAAAIHKFAEETDIRWFHWIHSVPNSLPEGVGYPQNCRYRLPRNSTLVYLNNFHMVRAAESYGLFPKDVRVVYNPVDPRLYWKAEPVVQQAIEQYDLLSADIMMTYPVSTPRMMSGKRLDIVMEIFAALKKQGKSVRLVVCNAHANAENEKKLIERAHMKAAQLGLNGNDLIFTSLLGKDYELGVSRKAVSEFFQLSNVFIFPSQSENCPLILLEAMLAKNLLILNHDVGSMRELAGENALYFKFGSIETDVGYSSRENYMSDVAKIINAELSINRPLNGSRRLLKQFNYDKIFTEQIEPLIGTKLLKPHVS